MAKMKHAKALEEQRVRFETEQAKESADHYLEMVHEWKRRERNQDFGTRDAGHRAEQMMGRQRATKKEILQAKEKVQKNREDRDMDQLYKSLFS